MSDYIDRQAAIDALHGYFDGMLETDTVCPSDLYHLFETTPSADVEPVRHGRWMERNPLDAPDCRLIECSECGMRYIVPSNIPYEDWISRRNYCVNCGARMDGEEDA